MKMREMLLQDLETLAGSLAAGESYETVRGAAEYIKDPLRCQLRALLSQCTEKQQAFFARIYPDGIDALGDARLETAIGLCERTLNKHKETK